MDARYRREGFRKKTKLMSVKRGKIQRTTRLTFLAVAFQQLHFAWTKVLRSPGWPRLDGDLNLSRQFKRRRGEVGPTPLANLLHFLRNRDPSQKTLRPHFRTAKLF